VVKVVVLECCEKTVDSYLRLLISQTQAKRSGNENVRVEQENRDEQIKKNKPCLLTPGLRQA